MLHFDTFYPALSQIGVIGEHDTGVCSWDPAVAQPLAQYSADTCNLNMRSKQV